MKRTRRLLQRGAAPREKAGRAARGRVVPDLSLWSQFQRIGGSLTPAGISTIIREADTGYMERLMDLANEARQKDCHLQSVLATSEESIAGLAWDLELPEGAKRRDKKAAEFVKAALEEVGLARLLAHHAGARFYGYAVTETVYRRDAGYLVPDHFVHLAPRRFGYRLADGAFVWRDRTGGGVGQAATQEGVDFIAEYPNKFVVSRPRVTGDVPCREGLVRVLVWASLFRNWAVGDWLKLGEIAWKPWRLGKYQKGAQQEDIDHLTTILEGLTSNGVATYPDTTEIEIVWAKGGGGDGKSTHSELVSVMASEMSKATLGQTLTTEAGARGARSLGEVHDSIRKDLREATARYVADDISRDLVGPLTAMNFGPGVRPARFRLITDDTKDMVAFATAVEKLAGPKVGLTMPAQWVRDQVGIPEPVEGEDVVPVAVATPAPPSSTDDATPTPKPDADEQPDPTDADDDGAADEDEPTATDE